MTDRIDDAQARHNAYAPPIAAMIIAASHDTPDEAMVLLESVIVGVLGHFFKDQPQVASETLDLVTEGALRRMK